MTDTGAANLFAAAKGYTIAMTRLVPDFEAGGLAASVAMAYYLLAGFALELSLKAIVLRTRNDQRQLRAIGHDLTEGFSAAIECGLIVGDDGSFAKLVERLSPVHRGLVARYVPDVEIINLPGPFLVLALLKAHLDRVEAQFDVWGDHLSTS